MCWIEIFFSDLLLFWLIFSSDILQHLHETLKKVFLSYISLLNGFFALRFVLPCILFDGLLKAYSRLLNKLKGKKTQRE
ncbi:hypothetical protein DEO72_LG4g1231 [Vigna unguiculata]|uniref:Uncharacterized protein n=1 Tax=Vigna unguiculata TaxID=3917 RepID=A0A4D6LQ63_VIGUN|nr:hypothetical protein DEO72_LG4g1231 [Vigna unguiculata]